MDGMNKESIYYVPSADQGGGSPEDDARKKAAEYYARHYPTEGRANVETLRTATEKKLLIHTSREVMAMYEDVEFHPDSAISDFRLEDVIAAIKDRQSAMQLGGKELETLGIVSRITLSGKEVVVFNYPGFEYKKTTEHEEKVVAKHYGPDGKTIVSIEKAEVPTEVYLVGTDFQRHDLAENLNNIQAEMVVRQDLAKMLRWVWNQTENLEGLVEFYIKNSLTVEAMDMLCNAEGRTGGLIRTEGGVDYEKGHEFGDAMSVALKCFEISACSENIKVLEGLLKRPGIRELFNVTEPEIDDLFSNPGQTPDRPINKILNKWIGKPWMWKQDYEDVRSGKDDLKEELKYRGLLTEKGNILVDADEYSDIEYIFEQVDRFLGGGIKAPIVLAKDARDARFIAWELLRITGMASDYGRQLYHEDEDLALRRPKGDYYHHDMGRMTSCDRVKVFLPGVFRSIYRYLKTENRDFGPEGSLGKYPDRFSVHYFKGWNIDTTDPLGEEERTRKEESLGRKLGRSETGKGKFGKRTFHEMRWGYKKELEEDKSTPGELVAMPEEPYYKLGELPWRRLSPKAYNEAALGSYIAGRKDIGLYQFMMKTDWPDIAIFKDANFWNKIAKHMGISMGPQVVFDGRFRGIYNGNKVHDGGAKDWAKEQVRNYKKKYLIAFWDGLRSLPQWKEWLASKPDQIRGKTGGDTISVPSIRVVKDRISKIGILTPEEARNLPEIPFNQDFLK